MDYIQAERIFLSPPHMSGNEQKYIQEAFDTNWIAPLGPQVTTFENEVADYVGISGALALSSGTAALHIGLRLLGVESGDLVFCSSLTFIGSVNPILYLGAEPVFIDAEPDSWNMSAKALKKAFTWAEKQDKLPKAVMVVDLYGQSADFDELLAICGRYEVPVIEDAAEALGAYYKQKRCGSLGYLGAFSFNGNKMITTSGGGMLISNDEEALKKGLFWATQARDPAPWYQHTEMGYNYRMSNVLAAIGRGQLEVLEERVAARRFIFDKYKKVLGQLPGVSFMPEAAYGKCNRWLTVMSLDPAVYTQKPLDVIMKLEEQNIEARPVWKPMHLQPIFSATKFFTHEENESVSDQLFTNGLCLPSGSSLAEHDQERVINCIKELLL